MSEQGDFEKLFNAVDLHPSLEEALAGSPLNKKKLSVALQRTDGHLDLASRQKVGISDGNNIAIWQVPSLRAIFRGNNQPPTFEGEPPHAYIPHFWFIERQIISICEFLGPRTDFEFEEAFSNLRRRPDGKSLTPLHYCLWQVAAGLAGIRPVSPAEFDGIFGRLTQSARNFSMGLVSRNYITTLRATFPGS